MQRRLENRGSEQKGKVFIGGHLFADTQREGDQRGQDDHAGAGRAREVEATQPPMGIYGPRLPCDLGDGAMG